MFDVKIREASAAFEHDDYPRTRKTLEAAEALIPNDPAAINLRGALLYKEKKYDEAMAVFQKLIDRDANSYPGYFNMAEVLLAQDKFDLALDGFERILQARPGDELCQYRVVVTLVLMKDLNEARRRAKKIVNPGQTAAYYFANATIEFGSGNEQKGLDWIKQSETFFPEENSKGLRDVLVEHKLLRK